MVKYFILGLLLSYIVIGLSSYVMGGVDGLNNGYSICGGIHNEK